MKFLLEINLGNAAMSTEADITRAMRRVASEIDSVGMLYHEQYKILDRNGNIVGHYEVVE